MAMESLTVITVLMGEHMSFDKIRQCRRPYCKATTMIPYRNKELGTGAILIEDEDLEKLRVLAFHNKEYELIKFAVNVAKASYENRATPMAKVNYKYIEIHRIKDEVIMFRLKLRKAEDIIFSIKPVMFDADGKYIKLDKVSEELKYKSHDELPEETQAQGTQL